MLKVTKNAKNQSVIESGTACFYFTGDGFTSMVRDFWNSNLVKTAIGACTDSGIPADVALKICTGKYKCVGDTREGDGTLKVTNDENAEGIYFTLESQIKHLEKKFVNFSQELFKLIRKNQIYAGFDNGDGTLSFSGEANIYSAIYRRLDSKIDKSTIEHLKKEQKSALENLEILYPFVNKTMKDLPITELGTEWSDIEHDHYETYSRAHEIKRVKKTKPVIEKVEFDENSYDQGDDESTADYEIRIGKLAVINNPIVDVKTTRARNAWISPDGKMYDVEKQPFPMHINAASDYVYMGIIPKKIYNESESEWLEKNGWMKFTSEEFYIDTKLTQAQMDLLMDYMTARNLKTINWFGYENNMSSIIKENESLSKIRSK